MKNFVQAGNVLTAIAPASLASGEACLIGSIFGVATNAAASGAPVELWIATGVVTLPAVTADTGTFGTKVYWDGTAKKVTTTATGNSLIGALTVAKTNTDTIATVRLNGSTV
jgi:predicted RecA/RadA family phage recombinase